jgi:hypothetical protein
MRAQQGNSESRSRERRQLSSAPRTQRGWATFERERKASRVEHSRDRAQWQKLLDPDS